jgi:hypothetical protein
LYGLDSGTITASWFPLNSVVSQDSNFISPSVLPVSDTGKYRAQAKEGDVNKEKKQKAEIRRFNIRMREEKVRAEMKNI